MKKFRRSVAKVFQSIGNSINVPIEEVDNFKIHVRDLVLKEEKIYADGEFKRHRVYAELIKRFPDKRKRDIALAIELAIQEHL